MQIEQTNSVPPSRKRRWFQFSLRALLVFVMLVGVVCWYVGCQAQIVRKREARIVDHSRIVDKWNLTSGTTWLRQQLGDQAYAMVAAGESASDETVRDYELLFPEAKIVRRITADDYWRFSCDK